MNLSVLKQLKLEATLQQLGEMPLFMTTEELAVVLRTKRKTLEDWRSKKKGPAYHRPDAKGGARVLYSRHDVSKWLKAIRISTEESAWADSIIED